jgi:hypothetical protein
MSREPQRSDQPTARRFSYQEKRTERIESEMAALKAKKNA